MGYRNANEVHIRGFSGACSYHREIKTRRRDVWLRHKLLLHGGDPIIHVHDSGERSLEIFPFSNRNKLRGQTGPSLSSRPYTLLETAPSPAYALSFKANPTICSFACVTHNPRFLPSEVTRECSTKRRPAPVLLAAESYHVLHRAIMRQYNPVKGEGKSD